MEEILTYTALEEDDGKILMKNGKFAEARRYYERKLCKLTEELGRDQLEYLSIKEKLAWSVCGMGNILEAKELYEKVVREMEIMLEGSHPQCIRIYMMMSVLIKRVGKKSEGDLLFEKLRTILVTMGKKNENNSFNCLQIAISFVNLYKTTEAEKILEELQQKQENIFWKNLPFSLLIKIVTGCTLMDIGKYSEAVPCLEEILKTYSDLSSKEYNLYYLCRRTIALCFHGMRKFSKAKILMEEILKENTNRFGNKTADRLIILMIIAECSIRLQKYGEAKGLLEELQRKVTVIFGKESFYYFQVSWMVCEAIICMRNFPVAESMLKELSTEIEHAHGKGNAIFLQVLQLKARLKIEMGEKEEAAVMLEDLLLKQLDVNGKYHPGYLDSKKMLAELLYESCKFAESVYIFEDLLRLLSAMFGTDNLACLVTKMWIAKTSIHMKKFAESETLLKEIVSSVNEKLGEDHKDTIDAMGLLAATLLYLGKKEEGYPLIEVYKRKMEVKYNNLDIISIISALLMEVGEYQILNTVMVKSAAGNIKINGENHIFTIDYLTKLAFSHLNLDNLSEAREVIFQVLSILPNVCIKNDLYCLNLKDAIANILVQLGEFEKGIVLLKEILRRYEEEANDSEAFSTIVLLAFSFDKIGKYLDMKSIVKKGLIMLSEVDWVEDHSKYLKVAVELASFGVRCEYYTRTINLCQELLSLPHNIFGENHPLYFMVMEILGNSFMRSGDIAETERILLELLKKIEEIHGEEHEEFKRIARIFLELLD